jgi:hypothetical protein
MWEYDIFFSWMLQNPFLLLLKIKLSLTCFLNFELYVFVRFPEKRHCGLLLIKKAGACK